MIYILLQGGLGNQMFEYAAARSLAIDRNTDVVLDLAWFSQDFDERTTERKYELNGFLLDRDARIYSNGLRYSANRRLARRYDEPHFRFDPSFPGLPKNTVLSGYFQSERYFDRIRSVLLGDFQWIKPPDGKNIALLSQIQKDSTSVAMHVRRGDYISNKDAAEFHGLTEVIYYTNAVKFLMRTIKVPHLYIFSDDPLWCKRNLVFSHPTTYVSHNSDGSEDMRLMRACRHNIIANSSFSWWAAWLNENPDKIVIAPKKWFANAESDTRDIIPKSWHKL